MRIALTAGEASGDLLGAGLIAELRKRYPDAQFAGVGGDAMRAAGLQAWYDASELAVMGLAEVLRHLPRLLRLRRSLRERLLARKPDVYIGIDAPDFNLGVERWLKQRGIRTVHYVSPSVWAWREKRAEKIGLSVDRMLCLFPMEPPIYARHRVDARFVGHPLAAEMPLEPERALMRTRLGLDPDQPVLALLPGSRVGEITRLGPAFLAAAARVLAEIPQLQVVVPIPNTQANAAFRRVLAQHPDADALRPGRPARLGHCNAGSHAGQAADGGRLQGRSTHLCPGEGTGNAQGRPLLPAPSSRTSRHFSSTTPFTAPSGAMRRATESPSASMNSRASTRRRAW